MTISNPLILVVDDHQPAVEMITQLFSTRGYQVEKAYSGQECLEKTRYLRPSLILLDVMMPNMDGFEVLAELRRSPQTSHIPVIFITARDDVEDIEQGLLSGADDYIPKPVNPRELLARARSKIESAQLKSALQQRTTELEALLRLSEELSSHLRVEELFSLILYLVLDLVPANAAMIYLIDRPAANGASQYPHLQYKREAEEVFINPEKFNQQFLTMSEPISWSGGSYIEFTNAPAGMVVPLMHAEQLHGILSVFADNDFTDHNLRVFEALARQVTLAIRNAELYAMMAKYTERLEEMVEERTSELKSAQELLIRAEKLASVGRLAAGIAHEINNPLMPIRLNLELIHEDIVAGAPVNIQDVEESLRSVNRISRIIDRLQQFTRKRTENAPDIERIEINEILKDVIALSRTLLKQSSIGVVMDLQENIFVHGSRDQLEQVFLNIVLNACAAMETGGTLSIQSSITDGSVIIDIEDTGSGIEPEMIDKIFEPFISTKETGTGLGLFISHEIIENHNGKIGVRSMVGKGTIFSVALPTTE